MNNFSVLFQKEWRENVRNFKILWIPLVFLLFGISEPLTNYYLPQILNAVGNMPEGAVFQLPEFTPEQIVMSTISQYQFIGMLLVTLGFAGIIARERKNGTATLLYVRPISYISYVYSKLFIMCILVIGSAILGLLANLYYTYILFGTVDAGAFMGFLGTYIVWLLFVISIVLFSSAAFSTGIASAVSLLLVLFVQLIDGLLGAYWTISPWKLPMYAGEILNSSVDMTLFVWSVIVTVLAIIILLVGAVYFAKRNVSKTKI
ncbi:ABC-2 type transport system permease protein [Psychrobacillus insolitus]|uniref:ABC-2 type transport system permease protein n=1 Tax=Psychrobacillus insolitus TaxID=1461 RepID=A0A2W7MCE8_9BACI|nr:ABC transporter permease subunit [Psychrobacillus insolitus]PZX02912.1 ABC-2 type transport system permease protein [Psychrobacillus insolitus]